jgi:hypothetical protein
MDVVLLTGIVSPQKKLFRIFGPYQLAWYLRQHDYNVQVIDWAHELDDDVLWKLLDKFITTDTKVFGWSQMGFSKGEANWWVEKVCETIIPKLRKKYPQLKFVTGGASVHDISYLYRNGTAFDYYFYGHAEDTMLSFCNHVYRDGAGVPFQLENGNKIIRENFADSLVKENKFDICRAKFRWNKNDCIQTGETLPLEISRGCIFKCKFCRYPYIGKTKNDFSKSIDNVVEELEYNYNNFKITHYYMLEDTFNDNHDKIVALHAALKQLPFKIKYAAYLRPDLIWAHPGQAELLEETGLTSGFLGIESFNLEAASVIGKPWSGKHGKQYVTELWNNIWQRRVTFRCSMIVGLPGDSIQSLHETNQWFIDNELPNWKWHMLNLSRDLTGPWVSEFDREHEKYGYRWVLRNGKTIWQNDHMTSYDAWQLSRRLESEVKQHQTLDCWSLLERCSFGFDADDMKNKLVVDLVKSVNMQEHRRKFLNNYIADLMNIST